MDKIKNKLTYDSISKFAYHNLSTSDTLAILQSSSDGLSDTEADNRLLLFGKNRLEEKKSYTVLSLFARQFTDALVIVLIFAGIFSFVIGEDLNSAVIFLIVVVDGLLGFIQEYKAEKSIEALKRIETLNTHVYRSGKEEKIEAENVVPGDILMLYEGDKVPADARLLEEHYLEIDESMLTGESEPVFKADHILPENTVISDRKNMIYSGCLVLRGKAKAVVTSCGMHTEIGKIARDIQETSEVKTPLQVALGKLGMTLGIVCIALVIPSFILGVATGRSIIEMIMMSISLAVSAIPEGLPIVVTIALALGIRRMVKVNVLIRKLSSAETLGGIDVICSDKTGTITHNQMTVTEIFIPKVGFYSVTGEGYQISGDIKFDSVSGRDHGGNGIESPDKLADLLESLAICSDATADIGDPTERAMIVALLKNGGNIESVKAQNPRIDEIPFNSMQKFMAVAIGGKTGSFAVIKGAPEAVFKMCSFSDEDKKIFFDVNNFISSKGLRVLAVARKNISSKEEISRFENYSLLGMIGMFDPPREEVGQAIKICQRAGIRVIMITGDHKNTAYSIAEKIGLESPEVITGDQIDTVGDRDFNDIVKKVNIFARVSPPHKVRILEALQNLGYQVAMTGDGVNDAPAVKRADVGIAVGSGTDLTKGISDMILLDDNFATIAKGVYEGRRIFFNIKKFLLFLLSANFDEILGIFTCILLGLPLLLLPLQILWLNLASESLTALALTNDVAEKGIMHKKPYKPSKEILRGTIPFAIISGLLAYSVTFVLFLIALFVWKLPVDYARTFTFTVTVMFGFFLVFSVRSEKSAFEIGIFSNKLLWGAIGLGFLEQLFAIYTPIGQKVFQTVPLNIWDWILVLLFSSSGFWVLEILKYLKHKNMFLSRYIPIG